MYRFEINLSVFLRQILYKFDLKNNFLNYLFLA